MCLCVSLVVRCVLFVGVELGGLSSSGCLQGDSHAKLYHSGSGAWRKFQLEGDNEDHRSFGGLETLQLISSACGDCIDSTVDALAPLSFVGVLRVGRPCPFAIGGWGPTHSHSGASKIVGTSLRETWGRTRPLGPCG